MAERSVARALLEERDPLLAEIEEVVQHSDVWLDSPNTRLGGMRPRWNPEQILKNYPSLTPESLRAVFAFAAEALRDEILSGDDLRPEYDFDFSQGERGRYYNRLLEEGLQLPSTEQSEARIIQEAKFLLALKLFEQDRISSGRAAEICGMERVEFLLMAGRSGVPAVDLDESELAREFDCTKDQSRGTV